MVAAMMRNALRYLVGVEAAATARARGVAAFVIGIACFAGSAHAAWMNDDDLLRTFSGQTLVGNYADGIRFRDAYANDGQVAYRDERVSWRGEWYVAEGLFCTFYNAGLNGGCFHVSRVGDNCYAFYGTNQRPERPVGDALGASEPQGEGLAREGRAAEATPGANATRPDGPTGDVRQNYVATGSIDGRPGTCIAVGA